MCDGCTGPRKHLSGVRYILFTPERDMTGLNTTHPRNLRGVKTKGLPTMLKPMDSWDCRLTRTRRPVAPVIYNGYPRILLALVLEFDSHHGDILTLFAHLKKKTNQLLRAPKSVGQVQFDASRRGKKVLKSSRVVERGEEGPPCDPGSEFLLGGRARIVRGYQILQDKN